MLLTLKHMNIEQGTRNIESRRKRISNKEQGILNHEVKDASKTTPTS